MARLLKEIQDQVKKQPKNAQSSNSSVTESSESSFPVLKVGKTTTVPAGTSANVTVTGTDTLNFFIPEGARGLDGDPGVPGASIDVLGTLADASLLPDDASIGDAYSIGSYLWIYGSEGWVGTDLGSGGGGTPGDLVTDDIPEDSNPINLWFTRPRVLATLLDGLNTLVDTAISASDTVLQAFGKLQAQIYKKANSSIKVQTTEPLTGGGDLTQDITIGLPLATTTSAGALAPLDKAKLDAMEDPDPTVRPDCRVKRSGVFTTQDAVTVPLPFNAEDWDPMNMHDNVTESHRVYAPYDGFYLVIGQVGFTASANTGLRQARLALNDAVIPGSIVGMFPQASQTVALNVQTMVKMNAGDNVCIYVMQNSGGNLTVQSQTSCLSVSCIRRYF